MRPVVAFVLFLSSITSLVAAEPPLVLFDGKSLENWKITEFAGHGEVKVEQGELVLGFGESLTGVTWDGKPLPRENYEVELEARRVDGNDFFCGLTFPVGDDPCSFILGGWGGGVVGLSSLDGYDASENPTTQYVEFEKGRWYKIRLAVVPTHIRVWLDDKKIIEVERGETKISIRNEVELSKPFGLASWQTTAALRNLKLKKL